jgi:uncharacterized small protein (DUF1192 family)
MSTTLLFLLLVLACPLAMWLMMRGGHGQGGHGHGGHGHAREPASIDDLRHRRAELDREIARTGAALERTDRHAPVAEA